MRRLLLVLLVACGDQTLEPLPCSIACEDGCPSGTECSVGFCAVTGETCAPDLQRLSAGAGFACGLDQFRRAWCWGSNEDRQIADSSRATFTLATVAGSRRWDALSAGAGHVCAIDEGELWCWGKNDRNQVTGAIVGDVPAPVRIEVDGSTAVWTAVSAGIDHTCGIANGRVMCWGAGTYGKLGNGTLDDQPRPLAVMTDLDDWIDVAAGLRHTCAVSPSLGVWCWGDGSNGQLGNGTQSLQNTPVAAGLIGATTVSLGSDSSCAIANGELFCWGRASQGALGDPASINPDDGNRATAMKASSLGGWVELGSGETHACGRRDDGSVYCWGSARAGGLGSGLWEQRGFLHVADGATALTVGWNGTSSDPGFDDHDLDLGCATIDGTVRCWGDNRDGQLAQGTFTRSPLPVEVAGNHAWSALAAGASHVCGIDDSDRNVYCWGSVEHGQVTGVEAGHTNACTSASCDVAVPARVELAADRLATGANHTCARDGTELFCWGDSTRGQAGASASTIAPRHIAGTWTAVFAGADGSCAIDDAGQVSCWGAALEEHVVPELDPELAGASSISLGFGFGCTLDATGQLACFGDSLAYGNGSEGTCGDGICNNDETAASCSDCGTAPLSQLDRSYTSIAVGRGAYACGLAGGAVECWGENARGQIGSVDIAIASTPNPITNATSCTQVAAGRDHVCAVCALGIVCWGEAKHGETGKVSAIPEFDGIIQLAPAGETWTSVTVGEGFTCGLTDAKRALCWGTSIHGALGTGARGANLPVAIRLQGGE